MLQGVRVLDLSRVLAGPLCAMTLGDLGADVIKVERPGLGDESRGWGPPFDSRGESAYYLAANRNKLGVALDLDLDRDRDVLLQLIAGADVVLDNFMRGALARRGIHPDRILLDHPQLVWCTITGFGPESDRPGYDFVVQAESGWMSVTGEPDGEPMKAGIALADVIAGKDASVAILAALVARSRAKEPLPASERRLFTSLARSATAALVNVAQNSLVSGNDAARWGNAHANLVPYQLFRAADRHVVIAVGNDGQWRECCRTLGLHALGADDRLATNAGRLAHRDLVVNALAARLAERTAGEWIAALSRSGVPSGIIRTVREVVSEDVSASPLTGLAPALPGSVRYPPPRHDEHGALVRRALWGAFAPGPNEAANVVD